MATYQKTIIIESNKRSGDQDFGNANINTGLYQPGDLGNTSNNRWQTHIPNGLPLEIGDTINLESSMINAVGGGDSVIELTGFTGKEKNGERVRDNIGSIGFGFYVTNTQQFNFNLPKQRFQTCYRLTDARYGSYANMYGAFDGIAPPAQAQLGNDNFYTWEKSYPYQCVEGCLVNLKVNNNLSIGYEYETLPIPEANVNYNLYLPSLSTGSKRTFLPNEKRFYIGRQRYTGPHYIAKENVVVPDGAVPPNTYNYVLDTPWDYLTQSVEFKVDEGFITPSSLAAQLTEQLHTREGVADNFKAVNVEPLVFEIGNKAAGAGGPGPNPTELLGVTDQVNITIPTSVGKPWYANILDADSKNPYPYQPTLPDARTGGWNAQPYKYAGGAQDFSEVGQNYVPNQGDAIYYSYMMTARPEYYKAVTNLLINMETRPQSDTGAIDQTREYTLYTGQRTIPVPAPNTPSITVRQKFPLSNPPAATDHEYISGAMGLGVMLQDLLPARNDTEIITTNVAGITGGVTNSQKEINCWDPTPGDYVVTNIIVNGSTKQILESTFRDYFMVYNKDIGTVNPDNTQFQQGLALELNFGRLDDMQTEQYDPANPNEITDYNQSNYSGKEVNIPCPYWTFFKSQLPVVIPGDSPLKSSYYFSGFQYEHKVDAQVTPLKPAQPVYADADYNVATNPSLSGTDRCDEGRWYAEYYLDPALTPEQAYNGQIPAPTGRTNFQVEPNTDLKALYTFERYKTEIWDNIPTDRNGLKLAFLPVCWKTKGGTSGADYWFGASGYFNFYYAWIYKARIPPTFEFGLPVTDAEYNIGFPQPLPLPGEYVGLSPSEITCDLAQLTSTQKQGYGEAPYPPQPLANNLPSTTGAQQVSPQTYIPYVFVGATDPLIRFDDGQGKFSLTQFHTPIKSGNGTFQIPQIPQSTEPNIIQASAHFKKAMITKNIRNGFFKLNNNAVQHIFFNDLVSQTNQIINAQAGVSILGLSLVGENFTTIPIAPEFNQEFFRDCIFDKMGFTLEQLVPVFGTAQAQFNRANYNAELGFGDGVDIYKKYNNMVKPFTTNAYISSTLMLAFARIIGFTDIPVKEAGTFPDPYAPDKKYFSPVPAFNLGVLPPNTEANVQAESDSLIAAGLPKKLSYPYLVVRTNLVLNPDYIGGESGYEKLPAIAYITRNYSEGDYFYSFTTNWNFTVDMPYVVSNIITDIRLPNGRPAPIDNNSSVIYKINKLRKLPDMAGIETAEEKELEAQSKEGPKVAPQS